MRKLIDLKTSNEAAIKCDNLNCNFEVKASLLKNYNPEYPIVITSYSIHYTKLYEMWAKFTDSFLNSSLHMIVCGRAGDMYEYQENENGKKELIKSGTRMATEKELSYEPSLLIEMQRKIIDGKERLFAFVEKDRSDCRITSYNVCYTKLLRFLISKRLKQKDGQK